MSLERLEELYERYCDRSLEGAERAEFERLMADPALRRHFVELTHLDTVISEECKVSASIPESVRVRRVVTQPAKSNAAFFFAASAAALIVLAIFAYRYAGTTRPPEPVTIATVGAIEGQPRIRRGTQEIAAAQGLKLESDDVVVTKPTERLALQLADATRVEIHENSVFKLALKGEAKRLILDSGAMTADVRPQPANAALLIVTPDAESRIVGTKFSVSIVERQTILKVNEGHVRMKRLADQAEVDVKTGSFATSGDGKSPLSAVAIPRITGFSLIQVESGKPLEHFNPVAENSEIFIPALPTKRLFVAANSSGTVGSVKFEMEGQSLTISKPPFRLNAEIAARVLQLESHKDVRYTLKATAFSEPGGAGVASEPYILNGTIVVKR